MRSVGASDRIFQIIDVEIVVDGGAETPQSINGDVSFRNVTFSYPAADRTALTDVSFTIPAATVTAVVGGSGAGKSTIVSLLLRLYNVDSGSICIDDVDVKELDVGWLRSQVGYVPQDPVLFATSILENIAYGVVDPDRDAVIAAARAAYIHDFIVTLPGAYDTVVGERGTRLSGGQRQRVAIARALFKKARILVFDEATSALDSESEYLLQRTMQEALKDRTVMIIAHRLSTVERADQIIVLESGIVVQYGTHNELLKRGGAYAKLVRRQLRDDKAQSVDKDALTQPMKRRVRRRVERNE